MQLDRLLTMQNLLPVDAGSRVSDPETRRTQNRRHGWHSFEIALLEREIELPLIQGISAEAKTERIDNGITDRICLFDLFERPVEELIRMDSH